MAGAPEGDAIGAIPVCWSIFFGTLVGGACAVGVLRIFGLARLGVISAFLTEVDAQTGQAMAPDANWLS